MMDMIQGFCLHVYMYLQASIFKCRCCCANYCVWVVCVCHQAFNANGSAARVILVMRYLPATCTRSHFESRRSSQVVIRGGCGPPFIISMVGCRQGTVSIINKQVQQRRVDDFGLLKLSVMLPYTRVKAAAHRS